MSRTVSFRASEELDEYLEQEAERRLTTKSMVVQMIVAEHFQDEKREQEEEGDKEEESTNSSDSSEPDSSPINEELPEVFQKHSDKWYVPDSLQSKYAVECPEKTRYYKTQRGAAKRLSEEFE